MKGAYTDLYQLYKEHGLFDNEINELLVFDVKIQNYFANLVYTDRSIGRMAFAHDEEIMGWLFSRH